MHVITIDEIEVMNMEESKEEYMGGLGGEKGRAMLLHICVCMHICVYVCVCMCACCMYSYGGILLVNFEKSLFRNCHHCF